MAMITFEEFKKLDIRIGKIESAERLENADKLLKLVIDFGVEKRQVLAGIAEFVEDVDSLVGKEVPVLTNLEPKKFRGHESRGMILAADVDGKPVLLHPSEEVPPGSKVM